MRATWIATSVACLVLNVPGSTPAAAQPEPIGGSFPVNNFTNGTQTSPTVGVTQSGAFVVAWQSFGQDGDLGGVVARKFQSDGSPFAEFVVNQSTGGEQFNSTISVNPSGDFTVIWAGNEGGNNDAHRRAATTNGSIILDQAPVNIDSIPNVSSVDVCVAGDDRSVAVWDAGSIRFRLYNAAGAPTSNELPAAPIPANRPAVACFSDRGFVVVYEDIDADGKGIYAAIFDSDGAPLDAFRANDDETGNQTLPDVSASADGGFAVAWREGAERGELRLFGPGGEPRTGDLELHDAGESGNLVSVHVAMASDGAFVAGWIAQPDVTFAVQAAEFDRAGRRLPGEVEIGGSGFGLTSGGIGPKTFVLVWEQFGEILGQRYVRRSIFADGLESEDSSAWSLTSP